MDRIHLATERWPDDKGDWEHRGGWFPSQGQHIYREGMSSSLSLPSVCLSVPLKLSLLSSSLVTSPQGLPLDPHVRSLPPTHRGTHRAPQVALSPPHTCDIAWFTCSHPETLWAALRDTLNTTFSVETLLALARETPLLRVLRACCHLATCEDVRGQWPHGKTHPLHQAVRPGWKGTIAIYLIEL